MNASRDDLDCIQSKLKAAIMSHAMLVRKMQGDPLNLVTQKELRAIQLEITSLSEKQKVLVAELKKEVEVKRMAGLTPQPAHTGSVIQKPPLFEKPPDTRYSSGAATSTDLQPTNLCVRTQLTTVQSSSSSLNKKVTPVFQSQVPARPQAISALASVNFSKQQADSTHSNVHPKLVPNNAVPSSSQNHSASKNAIIVSQNHKAAAAVNRPQGQHSNVKVRLRGGVFYPPISSTGNGARLSFSAIHTSPSVPATVISSSPQKPAVVTATSTQSSTGRLPSSLGHHAKILPVQPSNVRSLLSRPGLRRNPERDRLMPSSAPSTSQAVYKEVVEEKVEVLSEEKQKLNFLGYLGLISQEAVKDLLSRRSERKKRSTASSQFHYGNFDIDRRKLPPNNTQDGESLRKKPRVQSRPISPENVNASTKAKSLSSATVHKPTDSHDDICATCRRPGELLMCDTCVLVYHLRCLMPPLSAIPLGHWSCPRCLAKEKDTKLSSSEVDTKQKDAVLSSSEVDKKQITKQSNISNATELNTIAEKLNISSVGELNTIAEKSNISSVGESNTIAEKPNISSVGEPNTIAEKPNISSVGEPNSSSADTLPGQQASEVQEPATESTVPVTEQHQPMEQDMSSSQERLADSVNVDQVTDNAESAKCNVAENNSIANISEIPPLTAI